MSKIAIIDMGTNTFHLLLAEVEEQGGYRILHRDHRVVKIGKDGINAGIINDAAGQRAIDAMQEFRRAIDKSGISAIYAFGTSALRNASNGPALCSKIEALTRIRIRIIGGDEEARLIYAGVTAGLEIGAKTSLVMDIGAGSVEFIIGNGSQLLWKQSVEIGGQRLLEKFHKHDPITAEERAELDSYFHATLGSLLTALKNYDPKVLIGSSGTFDTVSEIFCLQKSISYRRDDPETPLSVDGFHAIYDELIRKNREERMKIAGMIEMRVDMIVVACCLIRFVLAQNSFETIRVSTYSLKEGVLATLARSGSVS